MKLTLTPQEISEILLNQINRQYNTSFVTVAFDTSYSSSIMGATLAEEDAMFPEVEVAP